MAITLVQTNKATDIATTVSVTLNGVTAGNLMVVAANLYDFPVVTVVDHLGNALIPIADILTPDFGRACALYYRAPSSGNFTYTATGDGAPLTVVVAEFSGMAPSGTLLDQTATPVTGTGTSLSVGPTGATTQADELAILFLDSENNAAASWAFTNGYTLADGLQDGSQSAFIAYKLLAATGGQTATATQSTSNEFAGILATFFAATGGGGSAAPTGMQLVRRTTAIPMRAGPNGLGDGKPFTLATSLAPAIAPPPPAAMDTPRPYAMMIPMRPGPGGLLIAKPFTFTTTNPFFGALSASSIIALPLSGVATATVANAASSARTLLLTGSVTATVSITATSSLTLALVASAAASVAVAAASSLALPLTGVVAATGASSAASSLTLPLSGSVSATVSLSGASARGLPLSATATAAVANLAISSQALPLVGTAVASDSIAATSSLPLPLTGTAQATGASGPVSSLALPLSGSSAATVSVTAASSVALPLGGSAITKASIQAASNIALVLGNSATAVALIQAASVRALPLSGAAAATVLVGATSIVRLPLSGLVVVHVGSQFPVILPPITFTFEQQLGTALCDSEIGVRADDVGITLAGVLSFAGIENFEDFSGWSLQLSLLRKPGGRPLLTNVEAQLGTFDPTAKTIEVSYLSQLGDFARTGRYRIEWTLSGPHGESVHAPSPLVGQRYIVVEK